MKKQDSNGTETRQTTDAPKQYPDCWVFDESHRVYRRDAKGRSTGGPIWREHWVKVKIIGETSRSWIADRYGKVPKRGGSGYAFSEQEIDRLAFVEKRYLIGDAVRRCTDYEKLRQIADLIGYAD